MDAARLKADAGSNVTRPMLSEIMFMSILIEQQKQINKLRLKLDEKEKKKKIIKCPSRALH